MRQCLPICTSLIFFSFFFKILKNSGYNRFCHTIMYLPECTSYELSFIELCLLVLEIQIFSEYSDYYQLKNDLLPTDFSLLYLKSGYVIGHSILCSYLGHNRSCFIKIKNSFPTMHLLVCGMTHGQFY
jgi:hypothetical protein